MLLAELLHHGSVKELVKQAQVEALLLSEISPFEMFLS